MRSKIVKHKKSSFRFLKKKNISYLKNIEEVNLLIQKIIFATLALPVVLMILKNTTDFYRAINSQFLKELFLLSFLMAVGSIILSGIDRENCRRFLVYYQICACALYVSFLGSSGEIRIYITYALIPCLSCMYYSSKTILITSIFGYISMIISIFSRAKYELWQSSFTGEMISKSQWLVVAIISFSIEYFIAFYAAIQIARKLKKNYDVLLKEQEVVDVLMHELKIKSEKLFEVNDELIQNQYHLFEIQEKLIQFVGAVLGGHDEITRKHILKTQVYIGMIANDLRGHGLYQDELSDEKIRFFEMGSMLHDVGKIHVPEIILQKNGELSEDENEIMKTHAEVGKKLLSFLPEIENGRFNEVAIDMAYYHHEWWNGNGYPKGLAGTEIPFSARIMAASDSLDGFIRQSKYEYPFSVEDAVSKFEKLSGQQFEPCIAESVIRCKNQILEINRPLM